MDDNELLLFYIVILIDIILCYLLYKFYHRFVWFDRLFIMFCLIAHMQIYISFYCHDQLCKRLRHNSDYMLFLSMGFSIWLKNKSILGICIVTMLTVGILKLYKDYCILTEEDWDNSTYILYFPILILQLIKYTSS